MRQLFWLCAIDPDHFQAKESLEVVQWKMEDLSDTTSEEAENIENVNQDTLKPSSDFSSQDATSALKERDDQINPNTSMPSVIGATESGQLQFIRNSQITFMARTVTGQILDIFQVLLTGIIL